jgi:hypothetical protein
MTVGQIAGYGRLSNGDHGAFLLTPCNEAEEDCDGNAASGTAAAPATQRPTVIPDNAAFRCQMMRLFGKRWPWYRGLGASPRD